MKKNSLKQIIKENPKWNWKDLNGRGFYELMQCYRHTSISDQKTATITFEMIKDYIKLYKK